VSPGGAEDDPRVRNRIAASRRLALALPGVVGRGGASHRQLECVQRCRVRRSWHPRSFPSLCSRRWRGWEGGLVRLGVQHKRAVVQVVHAREALQQNRGKAKVGASGGSGSKVERQVVGASLRCPVVALCGDAGSQLATRSDAPGFSSLQAVLL